jgi:hypothetical protein
MAVACSEGKAGPLCRKCRVGMLADMYDVRVCLYVGRPCGRLAQGSVMGMMEKRHIIVLYAQITITLPPVGRIRNTTGKRMTL